MIHLNIGSNLNSKFGTKFENISIGINLLINSKLRINKISNFYETPSYPNKKFPKYANIGLIAEYGFSHTKLLAEIRLIEKKIGRTKSLKNSPRVCDIDIIDFNGQIIQKKIGNNKVYVPHKRLHNRNFVLLPLFEINKDWFHPKLRKNIVFLLSNLSSEQLLGIKIV